jgi:hypothetical protein
MSDTNNQYLQNLKAEAQKFNQIIDWFEENYSDKDYLYDMANEPFDNMRRGDLLELVEFINKIANYNI